MNDDIKYIQNTLWVMYKDFSVDFNMRKYSEQAADLCKRYKDNPLMLNFCQNLVITWTPVINTMAEEHREGAA